MADHDSVADRSFMPRSAFAAMLTGLMIQRLEFIRYFSNRVSRLIYLPSKQYINALNAIGGASEQVRLHGSRFRHDE